jgi:putative transposase
VLLECQTLLAWWGENSKCAYQEAFRDLDRALRDFTKFRKGERRGRQLGFPRFKKRGRCRDSFRFGAGVMRCAGTTVTLPRLGTIGTHESTRKLARRLDAGTARNRRLARALADAGFGQARRMLGYKTTWNGGHLVLAGRWYPSSKTCSGCGAVKAKLALSERTYLCDACGLVADRDVNAARNLLKLAASGAESLNAREGAVRPRSARRAPPNLEPGTPSGGKTGTAARQQAAAA